MFDHIVRFQQWQSIYAFLDWAHDLSPIAAASWLPWRTWPRLGSRWWRATWRRAALRGAVGCPPTRWSEGGRLHGGGPRGELADHDRRRVPPAPGGSRSVRDDRAGGPGSTCRSSGSDGLRRCTCCTGSCTGAGSIPIHRLHHEYDRPRPLSLFVLNPLETLAFGGSGWS